MSKKKPTAMELKEAVNTILMQNAQMFEAFKRLDYIVCKYIEFNDNEEDFKGFLKKVSDEAIAEEQNKDKEAK